VPFQDIEERFVIPEFALAIGFVAEMVTSAAGEVAFSV
jgi:hypothetical protein